MPQEFPVLRGQQLNSELCKKLSYKNKNWFLIPQPWSQFKHKRNQLMNRNTYREYFNFGDEPVPYKKTLVKIFIRSIDNHFYRPGGIPARNHKGERLLLYLGIIDILQSYRIRKKIEHTFKAIIHDGVSEQFLFSTSSKFGCIPKNILANLNSNKNISKLYRILCLFIAQTFTPIDSLTLWPTRFSRRYRLVSISYISILKIY